MNGWQRFLAWWVGLSIGGYLLFLLVGKFIWNTAQETIPSIGIGAQEAPTTMPFNHWMVLKVSMIIAFGILAIFKFNSIFRNN